MTSSVVFTPEAEEQLVDLYHYITTVGSPEAAARYTDSILTFCEELAAFPNQGRARDDIRPGLRIIGYRRRVVVAFAVTGHALLIVGVFYGGRDYGAILAEPED